MNLLELHLGGLAGLGVGLFAIAVAAGATGQGALEALCALLGTVAVLAYIGMATDRYDKVRQRHY